MTSRRRTVGYLSAGPRVSTHADATEGGARAHVSGVIHGFEEQGWNVRPFIVGDRMKRARTSAHASTGTSNPLRALAVDVARVGLSTVNAQRAWRELGPSVDLVYERFASLQSLGHVFKARGIPWLLETNAVLFHEARTERDSLALWKYARRQEIRAYQLCDLLICISDPLRDMIVEATGVAAEKIIVMPNGVDTLVFDPELHPPIRLFDEPTIGFVGSLYGWQRLDLLMKAIAVLRDTGMQWKLTVVGTGPSHDEWVRMSHDLGLTEHVRFVGRVSWHEVPAYINGFDIGYSGQVLTSEAPVYFSPLKLYEYMAMAKPVVATESVDAVDLVGRRGFGFLVDPVQSATDDLVRGLREAWEARESLVDMGVAARAEIVANHSWSARVGSLLDQASTRFGVINV